MGDRLWMSKPYPYGTSQLGQLSLSSLRGQLNEGQLWLGGKQMQCASHVLMDLQAGAWLRATDYQTGVGLYCLARTFSVFLCSFHTSECHCHYLLIWRLSVASRMHVLCRRSRWRLQALSRSHLMMHRVDLQEKNHFHLPTVCAVIYCQSILFHILYLWRVSRSPDWHC